MTVVEFLRTTVWLWRAMHPERNPVPNADSPGCYAGKQQGISVIRPTIQEHEKAESLRMDTGESLLNRNREFFAAEQGTYARNRDSRRVIRETRLEQV
jgi:hypothetical protein